MKENVFDVLMYLFENYYMDDDSAATPDRDMVQQELSQAGFPTLQIDRAFQWMEGLASEDNPPSMQADRSLRLFSQMGVLTPACRELAIDRAMALESEDFDLDQLKWVILMVLFNQPGQEAAYAWIEDLVFDNITNCLH
jgi:Smg protein